MIDVHNKILKCLPQTEFEDFMQYADLVHIDARDVVMEARKPIKYIDFVEEGLHSIVAIVDKDEVEVVTVGREGFVGIPTVLGANSTICRCFCQVPGTSYRIAVDQFKQVFERSPVLRQLSRRYAYSVFEQAAQNSACNRLHSIEERCAKWLLLTHDRVNGDHFELTQEFLAQMLGVRRQSVNMAAGALQAAGMIKYSRGDIRILIRADLESVACECYDIIRQSFDAQLSKEYA